MNPQINPVMRAAIWAAVSSEKQAQEISIPDQLRLGHEAAQKHNLSVVAELIIPGKSRSIVLFEDACRKIPAYAELHQLIKDKAIDVFIFLNRSRLGRKASLSMAVIELCRDAGILCYDLESPPASLTLTDSHDDMIVGAIKSVGAQREVITLKHRHEIGMIGRIQKGKLPAGVPWGYTATYATSIDGKRVLQSIDIDPVLGPLIREMFLKWYLEQGLGFDQIGIRLNDLGHPTPTGIRWDKMKVSAVFSRVLRYAGITEINKRSSRPYTKAKGNWASIITEAEAEAVLKERLYRRTTRRAVSTTYLLSGVVWCAHCNQRMVMATTVRSRPTKRLQLSMRCNQAANTKYHLDGTHLNGFMSVQRIIEDLEQDFDELKDKTVREQIIAQQHGTQQANLQSQIDAISDKIKELKDSKKRISIDFYVTHKIDADLHASLLDEVDKRLTLAEQQRQQLETEQKHQTAQEQFADKLADIARSGKEQLHLPDALVANAWLRQRVRVYVRDRKIFSIEYLL